MTEREKEIYIATKQGDMCVNVVAVITELVQQMLDYCKEHNIKIEISKKIYKNTHYETINFFWKPIIAMEKSSIFANKLVALSERLKNRDLFDVYYFFSENFPINEDVIEERTKMKAIEFYKHIYAELPKHYTPNTILAELWDLISEKQKAFMKTKIVNEVQWYLQYKIFEKQNPL